MGRFSGSQRFLSRMRTVGRSLGTSALKCAGRMLSPGARRWIRATVCPNTLWPFRNFLVSSRHRFVYCWIPKVGCTTVKTWFLAGEGGALERGVPGGIHAQVAERYALSLMKPGEARRVLRHYSRFVVVRNPWKRIASAYIDKFVREPVNFQNIPVMDEVHRRRGKVVKHSATFAWESLGITTDLPIDPSIPYEQGISFRDFVEYLVDTPDEHLDGHWRPQCNFLGGRRFDRVVKLEELAEGISRLEDELGIPHAVLPHLHRAKLDKPDVSARGTLAEVPAGELRGRRGEFSHLELMTPALAGLIGQRYACDAKAFGYRCPEEFIG